MPMSISDVQSKLQGIANDAKNDNNADTKQATLHALDALANDCDGSKQAVDAINELKHRIEDNSNMAAGDVKNAIDDAADKLHDLPAQP